MPIPSCSLSGKAARVLSTRPKNSTQIDAQLVDGGIMLSMSPSAAFLWFIILYCYVFTISYYCYFLLLFLYYCLFVFVVCILCYLLTSCHYFIIFVVMHCLLLFYFYLSHYLHCFLHAYIYIYTCFCSVICNYYI